MTRRGRGERAVAASCEAGAQGDGATGSAASSSGSGATASAARSVGGRKGGATSSGGGGGVRKADKGGAGPSGTAGATAEEFVDCDSPAGCEERDLPARDFLDCVEAEEGGAAAPTGSGSAGSTKSAAREGGSSGYPADTLSPLLDDTAEGSASSTTAGSDERVKAEVILEPLSVPVLTRPDWNTEMNTLGDLIKDPGTSDDEKVRVLHEALVQRIEDTRNHEDCKAVFSRRIEESKKERDRCRSEVQRGLATKVKLESSCRELQGQKSAIAKENQRVAEEEQSRHAELKEKFQQAIKDVQEKMDAELEVRQRFLKENEELRGKLQKFTETYEAQEKQLAEQRESRAKEMEAAQNRLKEHESLCSESKVKAAALEKHNESLRKSQAILREELQTVLAKFDDFHEAVTGSNQRHGECKVEIDTLQSRLQDLEKENADLKANVICAEMGQEQQVAQKQRDALEKLTDNLAKENKKLQENLEKLKA